MLGQALSKIKRAGTSDIMGLQILQLRGKAVILFGRLISRFQIKDERHQRFGNKAPAIKSKPTLIVRPFAI